MDAIGDKDRNAKRTRQNLAATTKSEAESKSAAEGRAKLKIEDDKWDKVKNIRKPQEEAPLPPKSLEGGRYVETDPHGKYSRP